MNERIRKIYLESHIDGYLGKMFDPETFVKLLKEAICEDVKETLVDDSLIDIEPDTLSKEYLKGNNCGVTDALHIIKKFGVEYPIDT
jgi:hypothetical protein